MNTALPPSPAEQDAAPPQRKIIHVDMDAVYASVERVGRTSMGVRIEVVANRDLGTTEVKVTEGVFTFVALDANDRPRAVDSPADR